MIFPVLINIALAVLWGAMYRGGGPEYLLFASGVATGAAVVCIIDEIVERRYG